MQLETLAQRLGVSSFVANEMLSQHRGLFSQYWAWVEDWIAHALDTGVMRTPFGWTCCTGITEFNARSIGNFPVQAAGADILRIACVWAHRRGIELCGPVHDAVLIEAPIDRIEADVALTQEIMRRASRVVLNITRWTVRAADRRNHRAVSRSIQRQARRTNMGGRARPLGAVSAAEDKKERLRWKSTTNEVIAELQRAPPRTCSGRRRGKARKDPFAKVPLWWIEQAARAGETPRAFVFVWLLHLAWRARSMTFPIPNGGCRQTGR